MGAWIEICMHLQNSQHHLSLLSWERGLKYGTLCQSLIPSVVAPLVGAWIEIILMFGVRFATHVAPLVGAWIEIAYPAISSLSDTVAPLVGAWIEIQKQALDGCREWSLLSWERGLKLLPAPLDSHHPLSLLSWERGLKYGIKAVTKSVGNGRSSRGSVD